MSTELQPGEGRLRIAWVEVGWGLRRHFESILQYAKDKGCDVTYIKTPGFAVNLYSELTIIGPEATILTVNRYIENMIKD
jgi:hypothetical protein